MNGMGIIVDMFHILQQEPELRVLTMLDLSYMLNDMREIIKYNNKEYKMPFDADYSRQKDDSFKEEIIVNNRFNNEPAMLPWFAVAVYDVIMGSEQTQDWDNHRKGLDWFIKYFPNQYMVLLD